MGRLTGTNNDYCFTVCGGERKHIREDCNIYKVCFERQIYERLKHYEDLEEAGRLVELPCEVGDYIYDISEFTNGNEHPEMIVVRAYYIELSLDADGEINYCIAGYDYKKEDFGKTVFLTGEEAEAALKNHE